MKRKELGPRMLTPVNSHKWAPVNGAGEWARIKKVIFQPADRRLESFIPLLQDKNLMVFIPCRMA
jgi:hypothetical protein